jgi:hypothetical protein
LFLKHHLRLASILLGKTASKIEANHLFWNKIRIFCLTPILFHQTYGGCAVFFDAKMLFCNAPNAFLQSVHFVLLFSTATHPLKDCVFSVFLFLQKQKNTKNTIFQRMCSCAEQKNKMYALQKCIWCVAKKHFCIKKHSTTTISLMK